MDGTLTPSRQEIKQEMAEMLASLRNKGNITIAISGASREQMLKQLSNSVDYILAQSGSDTPFWQRTFDENNKKEVIDHLQKIKDFLSDQDILGIEEDLLQDRGSQMAFSFLGHNSDLDKKRTFDPKGEFRRSLLEKFPFNSEDLECRIGGTTCLDYTYKDSTKGKNIEKLLKRFGWDKNECIYYGDALFSGGNDETVLGVIDAVEVLHPEDLLVKLKEYK